RSFLFLRPLGLRLAEVPLSEIFGYATQLRSLTKGRASYSMEFLKYDDAPNNVAQAVIEARGK
ncbi:hypothetical protein, partial [Enterobacter hormaechei]